MSVTFRWLNSSFDRLKVLEEFDPRSTTWVVSDLQSRVDLQDSLIRRSPFLEEDSVLRSSELWRRLMTQCRPELRFVSSEFARLLIRKYLRENGPAWAKTPGAAGMALRYVGDFSAVFSHPEGVERMSEWFKGHADSYDRWGHWFLESYKLWLRLLKERLLVSSWAGGVLLNEDPAKLKWPRKIVVDMGVNLLSWEAELFGELGRTTDVVVLVPAPSWRQDFKSSFLSYAKLGLDVEKSPVAEMPSTPPLHETFRRFTTNLSEVKEAVASVRSWLDEGIPLDQIAVVAPDIGVYWPVLAEYLKVEGIPARRAEAASLQTFPEINRWLSILRLRSGPPSSGDLEQALFDSDRARIVDFDRFRVLFSLIYGEEDLHRDERVAKYFSARPAPSKPSLLRDEFVGWALSLWNDKDETDRLERLLKGLLQECPENSELAVADWIEQLSAIASKAEVQLRPADIEGLQCLDLSNTGVLMANRLIVLGVTEENLRKKSGLAVSPSDFDSIEREIGFLLPLPENNGLEFELLWLLEGRPGSSILTTAATNFDGEVLTPSSVWTGKAQAAGEYSEKAALPRRTRWDEIQISSETRVGETASRLAEDLGLQTSPAYKPPVNLRLSASALEKFYECPFVFTAGHVFRLTDLPALDLDADRMTRGRMMHSLFQNLLAEPLTLVRSDQEIRDVVESLRSEVELGDPRVWSALRERYVRLGTKFLNFELEWRRKFPATKTLARELRFRGVLNPETGELSREGEGIPFSGQIDRIDSDGEGNYVIIDYKTSKLDSMTHWGKWAENHSLQLALYTKAVERGLCDEIPPAPVVAAVYYVAKDFRRDWGFQTPELSGRLYEIKPRSQSVLTEENREKLFAALHTDAQTAVQKILRGELIPQPHDEKTCEKCHWRQLCRAPHLL